MIKLLHVDDDVDILEIVKLSLEMADDCEVLSCSSGEDALNEVQTFVPDALLLDVMMPCMSGQRIFEEIKQMPEFADVPVIFLTASVMPVELQGLTALGANGVLNKPFDPMTLREEVREILGR
jgi:CheY-like chemotaxis protein